MKKLIFPKKTILLFRVRGKNMLNQLLTKLRKEISNNPKAPLSQQPENDDEEEEEEEEEESRWGEEPMGRRLLMRIRNEWRNENEWNHQMI